MSFISSELTLGMRWPEGGSSDHLVPATTNTRSPLEAAVRADWRARLAVVEARFEARSEARSGRLKTRQELSRFL